MPQVTRRRPAERSAGYGEEADDTRELSSRRGRRTRDDDDDREETAAPRGRRSRSRDDDREETAPRGSRSSRTAPSSGGRGWASHRENEKRTRRSFGDNPDEFKVDKENVTYLIKPLEPEPFWSYCEHFVNEIEEGKRSFTCGDDDCPLCDYGHTPRAFDLFNIAVWDPDGDGGEGAWTLKYWRATPDPAGKILSRSEELSAGRSRRTLADPDVYLAVSKAPSRKKKGGRSFNEFKIDLVKERDLEEDYDAFPLEDTELDDFAGRLFGESVVPEVSARELRDAAEVLDD